MNGAGCVTRVIPAIEVVHGDRYGELRVGSTHYVVDYDGHAWVTLCLIHGEDVMFPAMRMVEVTR